MAQFKEIGRVTASPSRDIVASAAAENGEVIGFNINSYIRTQKYTGFTQGGVFVPVDRVEEFGELVKKILTH